MKCQILFSRKNKKNTSKCCLLNFLSSMQSVNTVGLASRQVHGLWRFYCIMKYNFRTSAKWQTISYYSLMDCTCEITLIFVYGSKQSATTR